LRGEASLRDFPHFGFDPNRYPLLSECPGLATSLEDSLSDLHATPEERKSALKTTKIVTSLSNGSKHLGRRKYDLSGSSNRSPHLSKNPAPLDPRLALYLKYINIEEERKYHKSGSEV